MLLYDSSETVSIELPLGSWEEPAGSKVVLHETRGGASESGRFGWTWDLKSVWNTARTLRQEQRTIFKFYGLSGKELWESTSAAAPKGADPVSLSQDGELLLLCQRGEGGYSVAVKTFIGNTVWEVGPFPTLQEAVLTPNGRFALLRWTEPDKASTHTFLSLAAKARKDFPSSEFRLGKAAIDDTGAVVSGGKVLFTFPPAPPKTP